jgi:hypothetical protein
MQSWNAMLRVAVKRAFELLYVIYVAITLWHGYTNPIHSWDTLPYTAIVMSYEQDDLTVVHDRAYEAVRQAVGDRTFGEYTQKNRFRRTMAEDPIAFARQFPFYTIKPLFLASTYALHKLGFAIPQAMIMLSLLSVAGIALALFIWLGKYLKEPQRSLFSVLVFTGAGANWLAGLVKPDALSAVLLLWAMFFLIEKNSILIYAALALLSIAARPDNIILVGISFAALRFMVPRRLTWIQFLTVVSLAAATYLAIQKVAGGYGWATTVGYYFGGGTENHPAIVQGTITLLDYIKIRYWDFTESLSTLELFYMVMFLFLASLTLAFGKRTSGVKEIYRNMVGALVIAMLARYVLWPGLEIRFYIPNYLPIALLCLLLLRFDLSPNAGCISRSSPKI